jgi:hypothetical protein
VNKEGILPFPRRDVSAEISDGALAIKNGFARVPHLQLLPIGSSTGNLVDATARFHKPLIVKADIDTAITQSREQFLREEKQEKKSKLTYSLALDRAAYKALSEYSDVAPLAYQEAKASLGAYTETQLVTMLGERFHTNLSIYTCRIIAGEIYPEQIDEPMLRMFERGRDYRRLHGSQDTEREDAEIVGYASIQTELCQPETPVGTMMVSISPPGNESSIYQHNFYDVFTLKEENGQRFIETRRYSSALSYEEYMVKASTLDNRYSPFRVPTDAEFLSRPIRVESNKGMVATPDDVHAFFHKDHETMSVDDFQEVIRLCAMLRVSYITTLCEDPDNENLQGMTFNALLNKADLLADTLKRKGLVEFALHDEIRSVQEDISRFGALPVRVVETGCGILEGASTGEVSVRTGGDAWSVLDFGVSADKYGKLTFKCPHCQHENKRPYNKLIKYCQNEACEKDVSC